MCFRGRKGLFNKDVGNELKIKKSYHWRNLKKFDKLSIACI